MDKKLFGQDLQGGKFYITAAIPYVNAKPHVGHALEFVQTDTIARYHKLLGEKVTTLCGADENALKNVQAAQKANIPVQKFVDKNAESFRKLAINLDVNFDIWQKGSNKKTHFPSTQKLWQLCQHDIYKKKYQGLYCLGCELFYSPEELDKNGECFEHPGKKLEKVSEENYFFRLSKYQNQLKKIILSDEVRIIPEKRKNEALAFIEKGLEDISVSRSNKRARNWGVPVPGDESQRIYVWFDALNIYQSGIGFGWNEEKYKKLWPADVHVIGKGILRFHAIYWLAFLLSAGLKLPKSIFVHDYFTVNGQKMSKSLGNVIDPAQMIKKYGTDALRYYFLAKFSPFNDGDFSEEKLVQVYNADLANGLGNLAARVAKLCEISKISLDKKAKPSLYKKVEKALKEYRFDKALESIWENIAKLDKEIEEYKLWENTKKKKDIIRKIIYEILRIAFNLRPFLPSISWKIERKFTAPEIKSGKALFPRIK